MFFSSLIGNVGNILVLQFAFFGLLNICLIVSFLMVSFFLFGQFLSCSLFLLFSSVVVISPVLTVIVSYIRFSVVLLLVVIYMMYSFLYVFIDVFNSLDNCALVLLEARFSISISLLFVYRLFFLVIKTLMYNCFSIWLVKNKVKLLKKETAYKKWQVQLHRLYVHLTRRKNYYITNNITLEMWRNFIYSFVWFKVLYT